MLPITQQAFDVLDVALLGRLRSPNVPMAGIPFHRQPLWTSPAEIYPLSTSELSSLPTSLQSILSCSHGMDAQGAPVGLAATLEAHEEVSARMPRQQYLLLSSAISTMLSVRIMLIDQYFPLMLSEAQYEY